MKKYKFVDKVISKNKRVQKGLDKLCNNALKAATDAFFQGKISEDTLNSIEKGLEDIKKGRIKEWNPGFKEPIIRPHYRKIYK